MLKTKLIQTTAVAAALILSPLSVNAQENEKLVEQTSIEKAHYEAAYALVDLRQGGPKMTPALIKTMRNQIHQIIKSDPDIAILENEYPGLINAGVDAMMPIVIRQTEAGMPTLFDRQAVLLIKNFSLREIQELDKIFKSPTFRRIRIAAQSNVDISALEDFVEVDRDINTSDLEQIQQDTVKNIMPTLSNADTAYLVKTSFNPTFKKFQKIMPQLNAIEAQWSNERTPEQDAEIEAAASKGYEEHLAKFEEEE